MVPIEDKVIQKRWSRRKISQITHKCLEILLLLYNLHILASLQKTFLFFRATFEQLSLQNATFDYFFEQFFEKLQETFKKSQATCGKP